MFTCTEYELRDLNKLYNSDKFEFAVVYGRRRVGKTTLLSKFCKDKVLCYGLLGGIPQYLEKFSDKVSIEENIKDSFLNKNSYFYDEPRNLLK